MYSDTKTNTFASSISFPSHRNAPTKRESLIIEYVSAFPKILSDNDKDKTKEKKEI